jgi:hypothetical protein
MHLGRQGGRERERERCCNIYIGKRLAAWDPISADIKKMDPGFNIKGLK